MSSMQLKVTETIKVLALVEFHKCIAINQHFTIIINKCLNRLSHASSCAIVHRVSLLNSFQFYFTVIQLHLDQK